MRALLVTQRSDDEGGFEHMSSAQTWSVFGLALVLFLFEAGPVWRHPWDMELVNRAVYWSYVPIPLLVIGCLAWSRRLSIKAFLIDTMTVVLLKYTCTFAIALVLWEVTPPPPAVHAAPPPRAATTAEIEPAVTPTPIDPAMLGGVEGTVTDAAGRPVAGALVWIAGGLEGFTFAPPSEPIALSNTGGAMTPGLAAVAVGQTILARSADGQLHTMIAEKDGKTIFNVPLLASGQPSRARFREALGLVTLRCNVHRGSGEGRVIVLDHPFFTRTDEAGRFTIRGVPSGRVRIAAHDGDRRSPEAAIDVAPRGDARATLALGDAPARDP